MLIFLLRYFERLSFMAVPYWFTFDICPYYRHIFTPRLMPRYFRLMLALLCYICLLRHDTAAIDAAMLMPDLFITICPDAFTLFWYYSARLMLLFCLLIFTRRYATSCAYHCHERDAWCRPFYAAFMPAAIAAASFRYFYNFAMTLLLMSIDDAMLFFACILRRWVIHWRLCYHARYHEYARACRYATICCLIRYLLMFYDAYVPYRVLIYVCLLCFIIFSCCLLPCLLLCSFVFATIYATARFFADMLICLFCCLMLPRLFTIVRLICPYAVLPALICFYYAVCACCCFAWFLPTRSTCHSAHLLSVCCLFAAERADTMRATRSASCWCWFACLRRHLIITMMPDAVARAYYASATLCHRAFRGPAPCRMLSHKMIYYLNMQPAPLCSRTPCSFECALFAMFAWCLICCYYFVRCFATHLRRAWCWYAHIIFRCLRCLSVCHAPRWLCDAIFIIV